ncbi:DUF3987 domain-containing protein [Streptomyces sp. PsTaAH-124]|uniref:DUF3987 domain-containing protein n=1 Tax=Streptomyces sp. PsTaAH-124 TaxID=1157638 RepID=UPI00131A0F10|nr:DUF3987 domain-containing protein [Streptomyces sp. PsTaAH-124]
MPYTEADPIGVFAALLALFSAGINGKVVQAGDRPTVVWTGLVGRSSIGCKGTAKECADWILDEPLGDFLRQRTRSGISSGPSLVSALHQQYERSLTQEDGPDGRLLVVEEEWQNQLRRTNRCPTFAGQFRTAWDGKSVSNLTKAKSASDTQNEQMVERPLLGFHAHIQPGAWNKYISATEALGGSYNRILPVSVEMSKVLPEPEGSDREIYKYRPGRALALAYEWARKEKRVMVLSSPARKRYDEIRREYLTANAKLPEVLASFFERSSEQVKRVACVLTAANRRTEVPLAAVEAAKAFVDYSIQSVTQLHNDALAFSTRREMLTLEDKIRKALQTHGKMTRTQLYKSVGAGRFTAAEVGREADEMPDVEVWVDSASRRTGPKPTYYRLVEREELEDEPLEGKPTVPHQAEAETLLNAYADWASLPGNEGKSVPDFLAHVQEAAKVPVEPSAKPPVKKVVRKRAASPRKAPEASGGTVAKTPKARGTAARKAATKTPAKKTAPAAVSEQGGKKEPTESLF